MGPQSSTGQRWKTSGICALYITVVFLKFTTASQSQTQPNTDDVSPGNLCVGALAAEEAKEAPSACELKQRLSGLSTHELQSLVAYYKGDNVEIKKPVYQGNGQALAWKLLFYGISKTALASLIRQVFGLETAEDYAGHTIPNGIDAIGVVLTFVLTKQEEHGCYPTFGCFSPQNRMALVLGGPIKPEKSGVKFYYYTKQKRSGAEVNSGNWPTVTNRANQTKWRLTVIIHGFKESRETRQVVNLTDALLENVETDIIVVDWKEEAKFPFYGAAATNTPLVGAQLSVLLREMYTKVSLDPDNVHLIGFSLGAHAAGFCGRHFHKGTGVKLGRISGLDPAGLLFENTNVSLSQTDADYVDVIHANGGNITELKFGTVTSLGHADFYPNGGLYQPGCTGDFYTITCSHNKAWWLYIESVRNETCKFLSIPCQDWNHYKQCKENFTGVPAVMGYYSEISKANGIYYLETNSHPPYCIPQVAEEAPKGTDTNNKEAPSTTVTEGKAPR